MPKTAEAPKVPLNQIAQLGDLGLSVRTYLSMNWTMRFTVSVAERSKNFLFPTSVQREKQRQNHPVDLVSNSSGLSRIQRLIVCMASYQVHRLIDALQIAQVGAS